MGFLLKALVDLFLQILLGMVAPFALAIWGALAIAALLWLATFSQRDIKGVVTIWLVTGLFCAGIYSGLTFFAKSFRGLLFLFLVTLLTGPLLVSMFRRSPGNKWFRPQVVYGVWVLYWAAALLGWRHGIVGLITITLPALLIAELGLFWAASFILPFPDPDLYRGDKPAPTLGGLPTFDQEIQDLIALFRYPENRKARDKWLEQRRTALRCLITYALGTNYAYYVVIDEKITERTEGTRTWLTDEERLVKRADGDSFGDFMSGPGIVLTGCDHAVVVSTGLRFKGAKGPGVVFTGMSETPGQVIDLRVQLRAFEVEAWTKDGIGIKVVTFIPFQIGTGKEMPELGKGFPYRASDVFKAIHAQLIEHEDLTQTPGNLKQLKWYDLPQVVGERIIRKIISRYEFDELYAPFESDKDPGIGPRAQIADALREELESVLPELGLQRVGSGISNLMPVDEGVIGQRVEAWKTDWARKIMLQQAAGQSRRLQVVEKARAEAQIDLILTVGKRLEQLRVAEEGVRMDTFARYFIEVLEGLASRPALQRFLPRETTSTIQRARRIIGGAGGEANASQTA
jgi:hypothetical protein